MLNSLGLNAGMKSYNDIQVYRYFKKTGKVENNK